MRRFLLITGASLGLASGAVAFAEPGEAVTKTEEKAAEVDCTKLEGDAKTECEAKAKAAADPEKPATEAKPKSKGGKAKRSNTNRLERVHEDE